MSTTIINTILLHIDLTDSQQLLQCVLQRYKKQTAISVSARNYTFFYSPD